MFRSSILGHSFQGVELMSFISLIITAENCHLCESFFFAAMRRHRETIVAGLGDPLATRSQAGPLHSLDLIQGWLPVDRTLGLPYVSAWSQLSWDTCPLPRERRHG